MATSYFSKSSGEKSVRCALLFPLSRMHMTASTRYLCRYSVWSIYAEVTHTGRRMDFRIEKVSGDMDGQTGRQAANKSDATDMARMVPAPPMDMPAT